MRPLYRQVPRQRGAIAIVLGLMLTVLFAMAGFVLDLGHLYIAKAELQNGSDGAALAGAMELNESTPGITAAVAKAKAIAQQNNYDFSTTLTLADANIGFSDSPDGPWYSVSTAKATPGGMTFIRIDTGSKVLPTYLMKVAGIDNVSTSGVAVAGRFVNDVTPIGVCAIDPLHKTANYTYPTAPAGTGVTELVEFGFRRGVSYNLFGLNPLGSTSDPYLINPVDAPPGSCLPSHGSANSTAPFMCTGNSAVMPTGSGQVYTNTGMTASLAASLNSRFDDYNPPSVCDPVSAPPDINVKPYPCKGSSPCVANAANTVAVTPPINWLEAGASTLPSQQTVSVVSYKPNYLQPYQSAIPVTAAQAQFAGYGALWSYGPAYQADAATTPFTPLQANANPMYSTAKQAYFDTTTASNYPTVPGTGFPASTPAAPYNQVGNPSYFVSPPVHPPGLRNRRVLNIVLINCTVAPVGSASCGMMTAVGVGRFFMQTKADFTSGTKHLDTEFLGLIEPVPNSEIKLYK